MRAGIKQVKNRFSFYVRRVREGQQVEVTDRGEVVAELRAPRRKKRGTSEADVLRRLAEEGVITPGTGRMPDFEPVKVRRPYSVSKAILEDRR